MKYWMDRYTPSKKAIGEKYEEEGPGVLNWCGEDSHMAVDIAKEKDRNVWTVVENDDGALMAYPGEKL